MVSNLIGNEAPLSGVASSNLVSSAFAIVWNYQNSKRFFYVFSVLLLDFFSFSGYHIILGKVLETRSRLNCFHVYLKKS